MSEPVRHADEAVRDSGPATRPRSNTCPRCPQMARTADTPSDLRFLPTVPAVPALSPASVRLSAPVPPYKGDRRQDSPRDKYAWLAHWYRTQGYEPAFVGEIVTAARAAFEDIEESA